MQYMCMYIYVYLEPGCPLFWGFNLHNKVFSSQNMGHLGSRHTRICIDIDSLGRAFQHTHTQNHQCLNKNSTHVKPTKYIYRYIDYSYVSFKYSNSRFFVPSVFHLKCLRLKRVKALTLARDVFPGWNLGRKAVNSGSMEIQESLPLDNSCLEWDFKKENVAFNV